MKPIRLKLKGFTAFREEAELDFSGFDLFAICGPTGSGKSSLLDAMTYALYGLVERVGKQVSQLVSHGQPRMAVELEFSVGEARYRVERSTPVSGGASKARLWRLDGDEWATAGEDADRISGVNKRVIDLVGLDYDAFTRSVLLPQGKFAEFLTGEAAKRREILTELLGLSLFKHMAQRANAVAAASTAEAETLAGVIAQQFGDVTPEALKAAKDTAEHALAREEALNKAASAVAQIAERWAQAASVVTELARCSAEASGMATVVRRAGEEVGARAGTLKELTTAHKKAEQTVGKAVTAAEKGAAAYAQAEKTWGKGTILAEARGAAMRLSELRSEASLAERAVAEISAREPALAAALDAAEQQIAARNKARDAAEQALVDARQSYALAIACKGLHKGDPCPVCGSVLTADPKIVKEMTKAEAAGTKLAKEREKADAALRAAETARVTATRDADEARKERARLDTEAKKRARTAAEPERLLRTVFGDAMPDDPGTELAERLGELEKLADAERKTEAERRNAERELNETATTLASARGAIETERARLEAQPVAALVERARVAAGEKIKTSAPPDFDAEDPAKLSADALKLADALDAMGSGLDGAAAKHGAGERALLTEAREITGALLPAADTLEGLLATLNDSLKQAAADTAKRRTEAASIEANLVKRAELAGKVEELGRRADRFKVLGQELRADRIIAFLQSEALQVLCASGTGHLLELTDDRYRLVCEEDEFLVVDTWNADEKRSVKTLSGGETFMASLSLALALCEQIQSLSTSERARLDSLFLDEGFGTLDAESLREVTDAIGQLGEGGRMVGVITHIAALADELPAKITVEKSSRGSILVAP